MPAPNKIQTYLTTRSLPWLQTRAALAEQHGIHPHPAYGWEVIALDTAPPIVDGLLWPLAARVAPQFDPSMPATEFSSAISYGDNARHNLRRTVEQLTPALGPGQATANSNTLGHRWVDGPASIELLIWPPDLQHFTYHNPAQAREPRLITACNLNINTGYRPPASTQDQAQLASSQTIAPLPTGSYTTRPAQNLPAPQSELEYIRQPQADFAHGHGQISLSADGQTLIAYGYELYLVPLHDILQIQVTRTQHAKGPGGSWLHLVCRCHHPARASKVLTLCHAPGPDDLTPLATTLAQATQRPLDLLPYDYDV